MNLADEQRVVHDYAAFHANHVLRGTPFYKPVGRLPDTTLDGGEIRHPSSKSLHLGRLLLACYENEFIYIPDSPGKVDLGFWESNYSVDKLFQSHAIRHMCEIPYFRNLQEEVQVTGAWSVQSFEDYFADYRTKLNCADSRAVAERIRASKSPELAARFHAIQLAAEFLIEASGMARNLQGYFGPEQSEYFKIVTDEYGYGVHKAKHSTLYKKFLESIGLDSRPHNYWWFYLPATLFSHNYINSVCSNHTHFFRHLGSLTQSENAFAIALKFFDELYNDLFADADTSYFREHVHIDQHHGRMGYRDLCLSLAARAGNELIPKIVRGFEENMFLGRMYRHEFIPHLDWVDAIWPELVVAEDGEPSERAEFYTTMLDGPGVLTAEIDPVLVYVMPWLYRPLRAGEQMAIPARTLFGILTEEGSRYRIELQS